MRIKILKGMGGAYEVPVLNDDGQILRMFLFRTAEGARRGAEAWAAAHGDCPIGDGTMGEEATKPWKPKL